MYSLGDRIAFLFWRQGDAVAICKRKKGLTMNDVEVTISCTQKGTQAQWITSSMDNVFHTKVKGYHVRHQNQYVTRHKMADISFCWNRRAKNIPWVIKLKKKNNPHFKRAERKPMRPEIDSALPSLQGQSVECIWRNETDDLVWHPDDISPCLGQYYDKRRPTCWKWSL